MTARIKILTVFYVFILAVIVFLADSRGTNYFAFVGLIPFGDKIGHFCLTGIFSLLVNLAFGARTLQIWKINILLGSLLVALVVALEEFSQILISDRRTFDLYDLLADLAGIFIFGEIARLVCRKLKRF